MLYPELKNTLLSAFWDVGLGLLPRFFARQRFGKPTARCGRRVVELSWRQGLDVYTSGASVAVASLVRQRFGKPTARRGRRVVELSWRQGLDVHTSGASVSVASLASVAGSEKTPEVS